MGFLSGKKNDDDGDEKVTELRKGMRSPDPVVRETATTLGGLDLCGALTNMRIIHDQGVEQGKRRGKEGE